jgi:urease accessory protein
VIGADSGVTAHSTAAEVAAGVGRIAVTRRGERSMVLEAFATSPLRLLTPSNHGHAAWIFLSGYGGGLVDGDHILLDVHVESGAAAYVASQASTKVYRSPRGTSTRTSIRVDDDALLVIAPDPVVCFRGSSCHQFLQCDLASKGAVVIVDWMTSGRRMSGERWRFTSYSSDLVVRQAGHLVAHDALVLRSAEGALLARMGRFDVLATIVVAGHSLAEYVARLLAEARSRPVVRRAELLLSASPLRGGDGCLLRIVGRSVQQVGAAIRDALGFVPALLGEDPWARKW